MKSRKLGIVIFGVGGCEGLPVSAAVSFIFRLFVALVLWDGTTDAGTAKECNQTMAFS